MLLIVSTNYEKKVSFIGGVMVSVLALNAVDRVFEPRSGQIKDNEIGICFLSAKHATLQINLVRMTVSGTTFIRYFQRQ